MGLRKSIFGNSRGQPEEGTVPGGDQERVAGMLREIRNGRSGLDPVLVAENANLLDAVIANVDPGGSKDDDVSYMAINVLSYVMGQGFEGAKLSIVAKKEIRRKIRKAFLDIIKSNKHIGAKYNALSCFWHLTMEPDREKSRHCVKSLDAEIVCDLLRLIDTETNEKAIECAFSSMDSIWQTAEGNAKKELVSLLIEQQDKHGAKSQQIIVSILTFAANNGTDSSVIKILKKNIAGDGNAAMVILRKLSKDKIIEIRSFLLNVLVEKTIIKDGKDEIAIKIVELLGNICIKDDEIYKKIHSIATDSLIDFTPLQNKAREIITRTK